MRLQDDLLKHPPKLPPYDAATERSAVPAVGKLHTVLGPINGEQLASDDDH